MIRFTKAKPKPGRKKPEDGKKAALNRLKAFLAAAEPETVEFLLSNWRAQENAITYKELREAYLAGEITQKQFEKWQKDYAKLITGILAPMWEQAADAAAAELKVQYPDILYEPSVSAGMEFIRQHSAELVTNLAQEQRDAVNALIYHVSGYTAVTPDEAARIIRPCVGLTKPQALANARYREAVKAAYLKQHPHGKPGTAEKKAAEAAARYAGRQHRYRAQNIARTELAFAYNAGAYGATKDAQAHGYIGDCVKVWLTAYDERVCPVCAALDGEKRKMDEPFSTGKLLPPAHPSCRCAVAYEEIPGTLGSALPDDSTLDFEIAGQYTGERGANEIVWDDRLTPLLSPATVNEIFQPVSNYRRTDGSFDIEAAKEDYRKFLQSVPEKYKMYLEQSLDTVIYTETDNPEFAFAYDMENDEFLYNPKHPAFYFCDFRVAATHEFGHRVDNFFIQSWAQKDFQEAIKSANEALGKCPELFIDFCRKHDEKGCLSDILSAVCKGKYSFPAEHDQAYLSEPGNCEMEIFANLFTLETLEENFALELLMKCFPDLMKSFGTLVE